LAGDNQVFVSLQAGQRVPVALISDDPVHETGSSTFFLERAIRPFADDADRYDVQLMRADQVTTAGLARCPVVVVGYVRQWPTESAEALVDFVRQGGRLLYFCGEGRVPQSLEQCEAAAGQPFFPFHVNSLERWRNFDQSLTIDSGQWRGRWLRDFDLASQVALQQLRFPAAWSVREIRPDAEILLGFSLDRPALALRPFGSGQVLQANLSPSIEFGDFGKVAAFSALVQILVRQMLDQSASEPAVLVGEGLMLRLPGDLAGSEVQLLDPTGQRLEPMAAANESVASATRTWLQAETQRPGFYTWRVDGRTLEVQAVNVDPRESDLRVLPHETVAGWLTGSGTSATARDPYSLGLVDRGSDLWPWLVLVGLAALATESFLLGWWRR